MKTYVLYFFSLIAVLLMTGCKKAESDEDKGSIVTIRASLPSSAEGNTKTNLDINTLKFEWADDEIIHLQCPGISQTAFYPFTIKPETISSNRKNARFDGTLIVPDDYLVAAFVGGRGERNTKNKPGWYASSGNSPLIGLRYPHIQIYEEGGPRTEYLYMIADPMYNTSLENMVFRHLVSIIHIPVQQSSGIPVTLKSITVTCGNKPISGCFYGGLNSYEGGAPNYTWVEGQQAINMPVYANDQNRSTSIMTTGGEYGDTIVLQAMSGTGSIGTELSATPQDFYIVAAPGDHGHLSINLTDMNGTTKSLWTTKYMITTVAGKVYHFPALEWNNTWKTSGSIDDLIITNQDEDIW